MRAGRSAGVLRSMPATCVSSAFWFCTQASALSPVMASTRRTPAATPPSDTILNRPMSPVRDTWVPPQSSREADIQHAHGVAVFLAEQRHGAALDRVVIGHDLRHGGLIGQDLGIDDGFHASDLLGGQRRVLREVETGLVGIDQRAALLDVSAQHLAQRLVHQVGGGVVAHCARATHGVDAGQQAVAHRQRARFQHAVMAEHAGLDLQRVGHGEAQAIGFQQAGITDLAARFGVERRGVQHHDGALAGLHLRHLGAVHVQGGDLGAAQLELLVAFEARVGAFVAQALGHLELARGAPGRA